MSNQVIERKPNGQFAKGSSGNLGGNAQRSRHALNVDTIREMHRAFREGGRTAILKVTIQHLEACGVTAWLALSVGPFRASSLTQEMFPREQQTPQALRAYQIAEAEKWWPIIKDASIKAE